MEKIQSQDRDELFSFVHRFVIRQQRLNGSLTIRRRERPPRTVSVVLCHKGEKATQGKLDRKFESVASVQSQVSWALRLEPGARGLELYPLLQEPQCLSPPGHRLEYREGA